ncbi:MAG: hypothetical protein AMXMBFR84_50070 [Candidatus Hydrogenedentota bacterium]
MYNGLHTILMILGTSSAVFTGVAIWFWIMHIARDKSLPADYDCLQESACGSCPAADTCQDRSAHGQPAA